MRRSIQETYQKVSEALGEPSELPVRKQFCLQFLKWGFTTKKADKELFVKLAKLWRSEEGRLGTHRTLLERKARKLFPKENKRKKLAPSREGAKDFAEKQIKEKTGIHDPEWKAKERNKVNRRAVEARKEKDAVSGIMEWRVHNCETGEVVYVRGLKRFLREHGLAGYRMWEVMKTPNKYYKGWRAERYSSEWENL